MANHKLIYCVNREIFIIQDFQYVTSEMNVVLAQQHRSLCTGTQTSDRTVDRAR